MNFDFSDEQKALRDQARKFLAERNAVACARRVLDGAGPYDRELWQGMAEMGWAGTTIPEAHGGAGFGHLELCVIAEELGRSLAPTPFSSSVYLFTEALLLAGTEAQKSRYLPALARGEAIGCFALAEGARPTHPGNLATMVDRGRVSGIKLPVADGLLSRRAASKCRLSVSSVHEGEAMDASLSPHTLRELRNTARPPLVIDVRREPVYRSAPDMIAGALRRDPGAVDAWAAELPAAAGIAVYCVHGHEVSQRAAQALRERGFTAQFVEGGLEAWREAGGEIMAKPINAPTRWVTRERPKIDRIACPWLISRSIDRSAEILYVPSSAGNAERSRILLKHHPSLSR